MTFIFSIIIGLIFGISNFTVLISIISILFLVVLRSAKDFLFSKDFITGTESAYKIYLHNLELSNKKKNYAPVKYILQSVLFDGTISITVFLIVRFLVKGT